MSQVFVLRARSPIGVLAIASAAAVTGALLLVIAAAADWSTGWVVVGAVVLALAIVLAGLTLALNRRGRVEVSLQESGYRVSQAGRVAAGQWSQVGKASVNDDKLILIDKADGESGRVITSPRGADDPAFVALIQAIGPALDRDRGYRSL